jgi:hypothetical protein
VARSALSKVNGFSSGDDRAISWIKQPGRSTRQQQIPGNDSGHRHDGNQQEKRQPFHFGGLCLAAQ